MVRFVSTVLALLVLLLVVLFSACHKTETYPSPILGLTRASGAVPARFIVTGRVIAKPFPKPDGEVHIVVVDAKGTPHQLWVRNFTRGMADAGTALMSGDLITAWCQVIEGDVVADSIRVNKPQ